jgi:hypothetical protein
MDAVAVGLVHVLKLGVFAALFLIPIHRFLAYRLQCARARDERYVPQADPWVSAVVAGAGVAAVLLVRLLP